MNDCSQPSRSLGLCRKHYKRFKKYGNPEHLHSNTCPNCDTLFASLYSNQKWCSVKCREIATRSDSWKKWYASNRDRHIEHNSIYYQNNRAYVLKRTKKWVDNRKQLDSEYHQKRIRKARYGIDEEFFQKSLEQQNHACFICKIPFDFKVKISKRPYVDHDHKSGKVRGLLCHNCNLVIGFSQENIFNLQNAIYYLEKYGK